VQRLLAESNAGGAGAHHFQNGFLVDGAQEVVQLASRAGQLDGVGRLGDIEHMAAENFRQPLHLSPLFAGGLGLDQHQLALDGVGLAQVDQLDHIDQLVELLDNLLDDLLIAVGDQSQPRQGWSSVGATVRLSML
jgi:hypothetical protein